MTNQEVGNQPITARAKQRKAELELRLADIASNSTLERDDIERALLGVALLLTEALDPLAESTTFELHRWLERTKHLGRSTAT